MLEFHETAAIFPLLPETELLELAADIAANGLVEPIVLYDGKILDGRNRYLACIEAKVEPHYEAWRGDDPLAYVVSKNLKRRHLSKEQQKAIMIEMRQKGRTYQAIAAAVGVTHPTVMKVIGDEPTCKDLQVDIVGKDGKVRPPEYRPHIAQATGESEWYTPQEYADIARAVMGGIDLDPASTEIANTVIGAATFYDATTDGLAQQWHGRVWMNPPYSMPLVASFAHKLAEHVKAGDVPQAIVLVNNATETAWFNELIEVASAVCFPRGRVKFWAPDRLSFPLQGQALIYIGHHFQRFRDAYAEIGWSAALC